MHADSSQTILMECSEQCVCVMDCSAGEPLCQTCALMEVRGTGMGAELSSLETMQTEGNGVWARYCWQHIAKTTNIASLVLSSHTHQTLANAAIDCGLHKPSLLNPLPLPPPPALPFLFLFCLNSDLFPSLHLFFGLSMFTKTTTHSVRGGCRVSLVSPEHTMNLLVVAVLCSMPGCTWSWPPHQLLSLFGYCHF